MSPLTRRQPQRMRLCAGGSSLHLQHLLQVFPALGSQGGQVGLLLTQGLLGGGQLGPHGIQLMLHLIHGPQEFLHLEHTKTEVPVLVDHGPGVHDEAGGGVTWFEREFTFNGIKSDCRITAAF